MMRLANTTIEFTENAEFLQVQMPVKRNGFLLALYTFLLLTWLVMLGVTLFFLIRPIMPQEVELSFGYLFTWFLIVVVWLIIWVRYVGRIVWRGWQFQMATQEQLRINEERLEVIRPNPIRGLHDAYDMRYVSPFFIHEKFKQPAFQYGNVRQHLFAQGLAEEDKPILINFLNRRFFPFADEDDEDEDDAFE